MKTAAEISSQVFSKSNLRIIPEKDLDSSEQISLLLHREMAELQDSGEESKEIRIGIKIWEDGRATIRERVITLKIDGDRGRMVVDGLVKNRMSLPIQRSLVGPVQLLLDEISGTYQQDPF